MKAWRSAASTLLVVAVLGSLQGCASAAGRSSDDAADANLNLGIEYLRRGRPDLAVENLERALRIDPRLAVAHSTIALAHDQLGNTADSETHHERAVRLEPNDPDITNSYAVFLCRQNRWSEAEPYFRRAVASPRYASPAAALANAGYCALGAGEDAAAESYFREALARDSAHPNALSGLLEVAYRRADYLRARAFLQRYLDVRPASADILLLCFNIETELEDSVAAQRCAQQLRDEFPQSAERTQLRRLESNAR